MATFQKADKSVNDLANEILCEFETHKPLLDARVKIDFVFAYGARDDAGELTGDALSKNGCRALGITRKLPLKDRAMGRGDAEVALDHDWWHDASPDEQKALLDHELHHLSVKTNTLGVKLDDLGRPVIALRKHDYEFGWFSVVAARHGSSSQEQIQARRMMEQSGQFFWPDLVK